MKGTDYKFAVNLIRRTGLENRVDEPRTFIRRNR